MVRRALRRDSRSAWSFCATICDHQIKFGCPNAADDEDTPHNDTKYLQLMFLCTKDKVCAFPGRSRVTYSARMHRSVIARS